MNKNYIKLSEVGALHLEQQRKWKENSVVWDMETKESSTPTLAEIDEELKPLFKLHRLFNPSYEQEMFDMNNINFANLLTSSKISLILFMIIGKIELLSIFLIFKKILFKH